MNRKLPRRPSRQEVEDIPVLLPHAVITVTDAGVLDVIIDGTPFPSPTEGKVWTRSTFGALLDAATDDRTITVRIEVHETDGTVFTDIIRARRRATPQAPETEPEDHRGKPATSKGNQRPELVEVTADGFVPGEDVALSVIVSHTDATGTGTARALLDKDKLALLLHKSTGEVVLLGRVSGTMHVRRLP